MELNIFIERENKRLKIEADSIKDIISKLNINKEAVIITVNNELTTEEAQIKKNDNIDFLSVISGG